MQTLRVLSATQVVFACAMAFGACEAGSTGDPAGALSTTSASTAGAPSVVPICPGIDGSIVADVTGNEFAAGALERCIDKTPAGGTLEIAPGTYLIQSQIQLLRPIVLRTAGTGPGSPYAGAGCYYVPIGPLDTNPGTGTRDGNVPCATLLAAPTLNNPGGVLYAGPAVPPDNSEPTAQVSGIVVDHVIIDANHAARWTGGARAALLEPQTSFWMLTSANAVTFKNCTPGCEFTNSAAINAIGWACMSWYESLGGLIEGSAFVACGQRNPVPPGATFPSIANGIDLKSAANGVRIAYNAFVDATDVALGFDTGSATDVEILDNYFATRDQLTYAELMLDGQPTTAWLGQPGYDGTIIPPQLADGGDYSGTEVSGNYVDCQGRCDYALLLGSRPWNRDLPPVSATKTAPYIHDNLIDNARRGLELDYAVHVELDRNVVRNAYAATLPFGLTLGEDGGDLTWPSNEFVPANCWQQDPTKCQRAADGTALNACCVVASVSPFDSSPDSTFTSAAGGNGTPGVGVTAMGSSADQHCVPAPGGACSWAADP